MPRRNRLIDLQTRLMPCVWILTSLLALQFAVSSAVGQSAMAPSESVDPIGDELQFSGAIARSLMGDNTAAAEQIQIDANSDAATLFAHAMWLLESGEVAVAAVELERVCEFQGVSVKAREMLAVAYLHLHQSVEAEQVLEQILQVEPNRPYALYLLGVAAAQQDDNQRSKSAFQLAGYTADEADQFHLVTMQVPVDSAQRLNTIRQPSSQSFIEAPGVGRAKSGNFFNFTLLMANEYDSNVPLRPTFQGLGSNFEHEDSRFLLATFSDLKLLDRNFFNLGLVASTYDTFQYELTNFNIQDYMGGAYTNALLTDSLVASLRYEFHTTLVNDSQFANEHRLTPSITHLGQLGHTTLYGEYNPIDNRAPALIPAQNQTGDTYRAGITQALYTFGGQGRIYGGYQYSETFSQGTDFDRISQMLTARVEQPLARGWIGDIDFRYFWDDYSNPNSLDFFEAARDDERSEVRAGLQKNCESLPLSLRLDYTYINNDSNTANLYGVHFYDYDRHVVSTQLIFSIY